MGLDKNVAGKIVVRDRCLPSSIYMRSSLYTCRQARIPNSMIRTTAMHALRPGVFQSPGDDLMNCRADCLVTRYSMLSLFTAAEKDICCYTANEGCRSQGDEIMVCESLSASLFSSLSATCCRVTMNEADDDLRSLYLCSGRQGV